MLESNCYPTQTRISRVEPDIVPGAITTVLCLAGGSLLLESWGVDMSQPDRPSLVQRDFLPEILDRSRFDKALAELDAAVSELVTRAFPSPASRTHSL